MTKGPVAYRGRFEIWVLNSSGDWIRNATPSSLSDALFRIKDMMQEGTKNLCLEIINEEE